VSGFSEEAFSLQSLGDALPGELLQPGGLEELHRALLVDGCRDQLLLVERLIEQRLAESDVERPIDAGAPLESADGPSEDRSAHREEGRGER
jgi:hypothetical protein